MLVGKYREQKGYILFRREASVCVRGRVYANLASAVCSVVSSQSSSCRQVRMSGCQSQGED